MATNSLWTPQDAPAQIATEVHDLTENVDAIKTQLEGKGEAELRNLHAEALSEESSAKQDLYMLRQRIANLGTDVETNEHILLTAAKKRVREAMAYLEALKQKIEGKAPVVPAAPVEEPAPAEPTVPEPVIEEPVAEAPVEPAPAAE